MNCMKNRLPMLEYVDQLYPSTKLDNVLIVACQHILETNVDLFDAIMGKGVKPENIFLLGKCYSTSLEVYAQLRKRKINISSLSIAYDSHESFDEQFKSYIKDFFDEIKQEVDFERFDKIIVLDDGGGLILHVNNILEKFNNFVAIEQTASGYEKLKDAKLNFPVINVAKSQAKLQIESPFIAEVIVRKLKRYIESIGLAEPKIVVVGQGAIGRNLYEFLEKEFRTIKYDIVTHAHPFPGEYEKDVQEFDVIIGATGSQMLKENDLKKLKTGAVLVSASSSDREFPVAHLRKLIKKDCNCHADIYVNDIYIPNSGFPINFDGSRNSVSAEKIQFTRALLLAGVLECCSNKDLKNEIIDLDEFIQDKIMLEFEKCSERKIE